LAEIDGLMPFLRWAPLLARVVLMRLYVGSGDEFDFGDLPERQRAELSAAWSSAKHWDSQLASLTDFRSFYEESKSLGHVGDLPIAVVTAGENDLAGWDELQAELAELSSHSVHQTVEGATHVSLAFNPQHAGATSHAILELLRLTRTP
jgi:hypothetical protein